ncbi:hypothetical protein [Ensifer aridi]|uniref:hypothetical protein n=1 Tax=Ensifer aridi TaxID=1708715 RepID=UPI0015E3D995|nr:hypothetical protein [Ensifer aridi]
MDTLGELILGADEVANAGESWVSPSRRCAITTNAVLPKVDAPELSVMLKTYIAMA